MKILRTPDERFADLPDWRYAPRYVETHGLRIHYVEDGPADGEPVLLLHGEPSWSYLYRNVIPVLADAGLRPVALDLVGFGRSDKPAEVASYTYARHVAWTWGAVEEIGLDRITLVGQDWGGLIGLRLVAEHPERFARVVAANTALPTGDQQLPDAWHRFADWVAKAEELPISKLVATGCVQWMTDEVKAAFDAPFPDESYKAGARAFPALVPKTPDDPEREANLTAWQALERWERPFLCAFSDRDPITAGADRFFRERVPGARGQPHATIEGAGHFLQEDGGDALARVIVDFIRRTPASHDSGGGGI
jgi:haloalkane dehalogenase